MKTQKNILIAFILNLSFAVFEYIGGMLTGSVAIISDSVHDLGDALSIGASYFLEKKSKKGSDEHYTYGYSRYSVLGGFFTVTILIVGSVLVIANAIGRLIHPVSIDYGGMIVMAAIGVVINLVAAWFTREGDSINQKAVNLHMFEDVLGWAVVLIGAIVMRFTDISVIDPIMSIAVAGIILFGALKELKKIADLFLEKTPDGVDVDGLKNHIKELEGVIDVHHVHIWSMDGYNKFATMHVVTDECPEHIKHEIREALEKQGISHVTLELETGNEHCPERCCKGNELPENRHVHHHHHH